MTTSTEPSPQSSPAATRRAIWNTIRGSSGNLVEWYDVYVYTVFATYFEGQFFDESEKNSTVYVYAIFAITFVMRPVGSWFFGSQALPKGASLNGVRPSTCRESVPTYPTSSRMPMGKDR